MRVSHEWLADYVELDDVSPRRAAQLLTLSGTEVERIEAFGEGLSEVVVARVLDFAPMAGSDHLWLARVSLPGQPEREVVCGAPNLVSGGLVAWARPGTKLPQGMEIGVRRIRGVASQGMLCAPDELGLGSDHQGVLLLPEEGAEPGQSLSSVFPPDQVYELEILSNRADCLCHLGVARELAAVLERPLRAPRPGPLQRSGAPASELLQVTLEAASDCSLYLADCLALEPGAASPIWLQRRLMAVGSRPIFAAVDLANYVMLELGQPLHTFDLERLPGAPGKIDLEVRRGRPGERLQCLDGIEREVAGELLIAAGGEPVALAGMIGGAPSAVTPGTRSIVLEAANFDWVALRRAGHRLGLRTEASARFERGLSAFLPRLAEARFLQLAADLLGAQVRPGPVVAGAEPMPPEPISTSAQRISRLLGMPIGVEEAASALRRLQLGVEVEAEQLRVTPAPERTDLHIPQDITEEVGRILGYDRIPARLPALLDPPSGTPGRTTAERLALEICLGAGFSETVNLSLVGPDDRGLPGWGQEREPVQIANPLSSQLGQLRRSCLPGLLRACQLNQGRGQERTRVFEWGRVFWAGSAGARPEEPELLALADQACGAEDGAVAERLDHLLALIQALAERLGRGGVEFRRARLPGLHEDRCTKVLVEGEPRGLVGQVARSAAAELELRGSMVVAEVRVDGWLEAGGRPGQASSLAKTPALTLDLAVTVPVEAELGPALAAVGAAAISELERIRLVDEYRGQPIPEERKGWTFNLVLRAPQRTLTHREAERLRERVLAALGGSVGAEARAV